MGEDQTLSSIIDRKCEQTVSKSKKVNKNRDEHIGWDKADYLKQASDRFVPAGFALVALGAKCACSRI